MPCFGLPLGAWASPPMRVRPYRRSDLPKLHEIDQTCFPPGISYSRDELGRFIHPGKPPGLWLNGSDRSPRGGLAERGDKGAALRPPSRRGSSSPIESLHAD